MVRFAGYRLTRAEPEEQGEGERSLRSSFSIHICGNVSSFYPNRCSDPKIPSPRIGDFYPNEFFGSDQHFHPPGNEKSGLNTAPIIPDQQSNPETTAVIPHPNLVFPNLFLLQN